MDKSKFDEVYNREIGIARLKSLIERLRDPENGCPWDIEQDNKSIAHYCIEEAHELQHAILLNKKDLIIVKEKRISPKKKLKRFFFFIRNF